MQVKTGFKYSSECDKPGRVSLKTGLTYFVKASVIIIIIIQLKQNHPPAIQNINMPKITCNDGGYYY